MQLRTSATINYYGRVQAKFRGTTLIILWSWEYDLFSLIDTEIEQKYCTYMCWEVRLKPTFLCCVVSFSEHFLDIESLSLLLSISRMCAQIGAAFETKGYFSSQWFQVVLIKHRFTQAPFQNTFNVKIKYAFLKKKHLKNKLVSLVPPKVW